jgi:flagellar motor switch protein FliG
VPPIKQSVPLTGLKKAAVLMIALGPEIAAEIYRNLSDKEIELITIEIANSGRVTPELIAQVIEEFYHTCMAKQYVAHGGITTARQILERALGPGKSMEILQRLQGVFNTKPFDFLKHLDPTVLCRFVQNEHPQTIALVLSHLHYDQAALVMASLDPEMQSEVSLRIATMKETSPEIIADVERVMEKKFSSILAQETTIAGGVETLAELLDHIDQRTQKALLASMEQQEPLIANEVKKKLITFDDLERLDDHSVQKMLFRVDNKELATALKGANDGVKKQIMKNMSIRAARMLQEDMELMGPVRVSKVEESQQKIISTIRKMEEDGEITISRSPNEKFL